METSNSLQKPPGIWGLPHLEEMSIYTTVAVPNDQNPPPQEPPATWGAPTTQPLHTTPTQQETMFSWRQREEYQPPQPPQPPQSQYSPPIPPPMQDQTLSNMQNYIAKYCPSHPYQSHNPKHRPYLSCFDDYVLDTHLGETLGVEQIQTMQQKFNNAIQLVLTARQQPQRPVAQEEARITVYNNAWGRSHALTFYELQHLAHNSRAPLFYRDPTTGYWQQIQHDRLPVHLFPPPPPRR